MTTYAKNTQVSVEKSKGEIERILQRYGAAKYMSGWDQIGAAIAFQLNGRVIRFLLPLPDKAKFMTTPSKGRQRSPEIAHKAWEQSCRESWRSLALAIKAKLQAVESGIATFENEFLAYTVLPTGETVGEYCQPKIDEMLKTKKMPKLLPG